MEEMSRMRRQMTAIETIREFCRVWFEERDWKKTVEYLTEDVTFVGTGEHESARGKEDGRVSPGGYSGDSGAL